MALTNMHNNFIYPVDTYDFVQIRQDGLLYVDKTDLVFDLVTKYRYVFLSRPRRFGKSLLCSTLKAYWQGRKELFDGLMIANLEKNWHSYPVFHFSMSGLKDLPTDKAQSKLENFISDYERTYGRNVEEKSPGARFRGLIHRAKQQTGQRVVVILDEYDAPIMRLIYEPEQLKEVRSLLREFYQVLKDEGECIKFAFITGITKFSQLSIFSELNNLMDISFLPEYSGICGITKGEICTTLRPNVEDFAEGYGCGVDEAYELLGKQYDGYHFSADSKDVFAPFSLLKALSEKSIKDYWFTGATPSALIEHLKHFPIASAIEFDGVEVSENQFNIPCEDAPTPMPLLYQSGYLSIDSYDRQLKTFILHFPNTEVRSGMVDCLMPIILRRTPTENDSTITDMARAIYSGDLSSALLHLRSYMAGIPYDVITKEEWEDKQKRESFYKMLIYLVFSLLNTKVDTEVKSILGRADVVIQTKTDVYVLELKVDQSVNSAMAQIDSREYAVRWEADERRITKCGVRIGSKQRTITHWKITDNEGHTLQEKRLK